MHWKAMTDAPYLGIWNLMTEDGKYVDAVVEIERVEKHTTPAVTGRKASTKPLIYFRGKDKPLLANATNCKVLSHLFGPNTNDWRGKRIILYADENVAFGGQITGGVRIRPRQPEAKAKRAAGQGETPQPTATESEAVPAPREPGED